MKTNFINIRQNQGRVTTLIRSR